MATNPHIYVDSNNGTNTGGGGDTSFASQQTGAMSSITASSVYDSIGAAIQGSSPSTGDTIYVADNSNGTHATGRTLQSAAAGDAGIRVISVDTANVDQYKPGAVDGLSGTADWLFTNAILIAGVTLVGEDNMTGNTNATITVIDGGLSTWDRMDFLTDGVSLKLINSTLGHPVASGLGVNFGGGSTIQWDGGTYTGVAPTNMFFFSPAEGGGNFLMNGVDLTALTTAFFASVSGISDNFIIRLTNCQLHASVTIPYTEMTKTGHRFEMFNTDVTGDSDFHRFYIADGNGRAKNNDATYVTATETWYEGSVKSSIEVETQARCSHLYPFVFELPAQYVDLSQAASDVITLELTTDLTLTDTDIASFLVYPDGTTSVIANWVTSGKTVGTGNYGNDPLAAGTTLTTGSLGAGDWTGEPTSPNFYKMVLDTSGDAGQATAVSIRIEVYKASIAAGKLFIHPLLTLS